MLHRDLPRSGIFLSLSRAFLQRPRIGGNNEEIYAFAEFAIVPSYLISIEKHQRVGDVLE